MRPLARLAVLVPLLAALLAGLPPSRATADGDTRGYLRTDGSRIVDAAGRPVILTGVNWFGLETPSYAPHGLGQRNWQSLLDQIVDLGFNAIRLPYSNQLLDTGSQPGGINYELNPDLQGLTGLEIMDRIIEGAGERGLVVVLDRHRPGSGAQSALWYTVAYSEERWIQDWVMLARRYAGNPTVVGVDLHNEPHGLATWGTGNMETDWRLAAERAGNAILEANPDLLIIVQGIDNYAGDWYWWGGSLAGVRDHPVRLRVPDRLVYSTHDYGPGVYPQPWFYEPGFPQNLEGLWNRHWAYIHDEGRAPVLVGEFGGRSVGGDTEGIWQRSLVEFLRMHDISYFYWSLNPNSGDTGGILLDDWRTVDDAKAAMLASHQFPLLGDSPLEQAVIHPTVNPGALEAGALQVIVRSSEAPGSEYQTGLEIVIQNTGSLAVPFHELEVAAWFGEPVEGQLAFQCVWFAFDCRNLEASLAPDDQGFSKLQLRFGPGAGELEAGGTSGVIRGALRPQGAALEALALYLDGRIVWGEEPSDPAMEPPMNDESAREQEVQPAVGPTATGEPALVGGAALVIGSAALAGALVAGLIVMVAFRKR